MRSISSLAVVALGIFAPSPCYGSYESSHLTNWEQIHQVINLYSLAVDFNQTRELFPKIFAQDAFANYTGANSNLHGVQNIINALAPDADKFKAQHSAGTLYIDFTSKSTANVTSYEIATLFGEGSQAGKQVQLYGLYRDQFELIEGQGWRVKTRFYSQLGPPFGNTSVLNGP